MISELKGPFHVDIHDPEQLRIFQSALRSGYHCGQLGFLVDFLQNSDAPKDVLDCAESEQSARGQEHAHYLVSLAHATRAVPGGKTKVYGVPFITEFVLYDSKTGEELHPPPDEPLWERTIGNEWVMPANAAWAFHDMFKDRLKTGRPVPEKEKLWRIDVSDKQQMEAFEGATNERIGFTKFCDMLDFLHELGKHAPKKFVSFAEEGMAATRMALADFIFQLCNAVGVPIRSWTEDGEEHLQLPSLAKFVLYDSKTRKVWSTIEEYLDYKNTR